MKRTVVILFVTVLLCRLGSAQIVIRPLNGDIQYQYQSQDYTSAGFHSSTSSHNPMIDIGTSGSIFDPAIVSFDLRSSLNLNNMSTSASAYSISNNQFFWNYYNLGLTLLRNLPVNVGILLNDGFRQTSLSTPQGDLGGMRTRKQEENLRLICHHVSFLPSISFSVDRSHEWSFNSRSPVDNLNTNYLIDLSSSGQGGSVNVSGSMSENAELYTGTSSRFYTLLLHGVRNFANLENLNYDINYNRYSDVTNIRGTASYVNASDKKFHYSSMLSSHSNSTLTFQTNQASLSQSFQYIQNDNYFYSLGLSGNYERDASSVGGGYGNSYGGANASCGIQHSDVFKSVGYSNGLSFGYGFTRSSPRQTTFTTGLSNGIHASLGGAGLSATDAISYGQVNDDSSRSWVSNALNIDLNYSGVTVYDFQVQLSAAFQDENNGNLPQGYGNHRDLQLGWSVNSPLMYYYIPFTIAANGGENWFFGTVVGRTFNWSAIFSSPQFFVRNLTMFYRLSRTFDPTYQRQSIMHSIESRYQWRAITLGLRYEIYRLVSSQNSLWFTISRPF